MADIVYRILLIEDNPGDARLIKELLVQTGSTSFIMEWADWLSKGLERLSHGGIDAVLLDLTLPDSRGFDTFVKTHAQFPEVPVILMTGLDDEEMAVRAVREGAQDYMVKGQVSGPALVRAMRYAIERHRQTVRTAEPETGRKRGKVIGFMGAKGGVGTTALALNIASILAQKSTTIALELHPSQGSFSHQMRQVPAMNMSSLLNAEPSAINDTDVRTRLYKFNSGLQVMFGPQCVEEFRDISPEHATALINRLAAMAEVLVLDVPSEPSPAVQAALKQCSFVCLVIEPEWVSLGAAKTKLQTLSAWGVGAALVGVIFNGRALLANPLRLSDLRTQLACPILGMVPPAPDAFMMANQTGTPLTLLRPDAAVSSAMAEIGRRLMENPVEVMKF